MQQASGLKVMGPTKRGLPLPDQGQERSLRGRTADKSLFAPNPDLRMMRATMPVAHLTMPSATA